MATSAFKSTTRRAPIGAADDSASSSNKAHRRSRSLSRFSRPIPEPEPEFAEYLPKSRGRFVNVVRGSGFPEVSLDDLAIGFFPLKDFPDGSDDGGRGRNACRGFSDIANAATASSQRRGRSVSRQSSRASDVNGVVSNGSGAGKPVLEANSRRRRSVSVVRYQIGDSESDHANSKSSVKENGLNSPSKRLTAPSHRQLRRSRSQRDLLKSYDGYSSQSSALTDDETRSAHSGRNAIEKTIRAVYAQKKTDHPTGDDVNSELYAAMKKELRCAVEEIKMAMTRNTSSLATGDTFQQKKSDVTQAVSAIRKNYATKLEQSEKRKQDLLAEILLEDQRGRELSKIVRELLPDKSSSSVSQKPSRARKRSNDGNNMAKQLTEEAEKYFEDFTSNVEDTDISSFDGEQSDTSSPFVRTAKPRHGVIHCEETETHKSPKECTLPVEMEGVLLPWLKWETSNDGSSLPGKISAQSPLTPKTLLWDEVQEMASVNDPSSHFISSRGSWSPGTIDCHSVVTGDDRRIRYFDMDDYLKRLSEEELFIERWKERHRISSGGLLLCSSAH